MPPSEVSFPPPHSLLHLSVTILDATMSAMPPAKKAMDTSIQNTEQHVRAGL